MSETTHAGLSPRTTVDESPGESFDAGTCAECGEPADGFDALTRTAKCRDCAGDST